MSLKFLEHEKLQFFKHFKNHFALHRFGLQLTERNWAKTRKFKIYRADFLNHKVAFFFDTLKKNLMFGLSAGSFVSRSSAVSSTTANWFFPVLSFNDTLFQSLGLFENTVFRFLFYLNDWIICVFTWGAYRVFYVLANNPIPHAKIIANYYLILPNYFPYFSTFGGNERFCLGMRWHIFFFISLNTGAGLFPRLTYRIEGVVT